MPGTVSHLLFHPHALSNGSSLPSEGLTLCPEQPLQELLTLLGSASRWSYSGSFPATASPHEMSQHGDSLLQRHRGEKAATTVLFKLVQLSLRPL